MGRRKRLPRCLFCNRQLVAPEIARRTCEDCALKGRSWTDDLPPPKTRPSDDEPAADADDNESADAPPPRHFPAFLIALAVLVPFWAVLAAAATVWEPASYILFVFGACVTLVGVIQLYASAAEDGIEIWAIVSRNPIFAIALFAIQVVVVPVFSLVYLVMNFESAWKCVLLELVGAGMVATAILLL